MEANPADFDRDKAAAWRLAGINRISLGGQTFSDAGLRLLGRRHRAEEIGRAVGFIRLAGIENLSLDLICAWPEESFMVLERDLEQLVNLQPDHVSVYLLSLEAGTVMERLVREGRVKAIIDDDQVRMMELAAERLEKAGFLQYEVSNFSRAVAFQSRHNLAYWYLSDYLGLGAGACGSRRCRIGESHWAERYLNHADFRSYLDEIIGFRPGPTGAEMVGEEDFSFPWESLEIIDRDASFREALMLGLRLRRGVCLAELAKEYGSERVSGVIGKSKPLLREGLLAMENGYLRVTEKGLPLSDEITVAVI
jgi:oxygen-independent coproporphyrinogen-3 oxidase